MKLKKLVHIETQETAAVQYKKWLCIEVPPLGSAEWQLSGGEATPGGLWPESVKYAKTSELNGNQTNLPDHDSAKNSDQ